MNNFGVGKMPAQLANDLDDVDKRSIAAQGQEPERGIRNSERGIRDSGRCFSIAFLAIEKRQLNGAAAENLCRLAPVYG